MKKITSFLVMAVLGCASAFAQATEYANKLITIGTAQAEMVPGQWYFLHSPRNPNASAEAFAEVGGSIQSAGGFVTDMGVGTGIKLTATSVIDEVTNPEGVNANNYMASIVRFVEVEGEEGAYNIQFGTGSWVGHHDGGNGTNIATVNHNNYVAGNAGKYNFYLVTIGGEPNAVGRFGWNKFDMANRLDNNGAGGTVVFWAEGETTGESEGYTTDDEIMGNKIWQIYDIVEVGEVDMYEDALQALNDDYTAITSQSDGNIIQNLMDSVNVGNKPGNYRPEDVAAFLEIHAQVEALMETWEFEGVEAIQAQFPTAEDLKKFNDDYVAAWNHMIENKVPRAMSNIKPGYYTINSVLFWYKNVADSVFYTQEEADSINAADSLAVGDSLYISAGDFKETVSRQVPQTKKALFSAPAQGSDGVMADWLAWGPQMPEAEYLWKVETVEGKPTEYRVTNAANGKTHVSIGQSSNSRLALNDTATICFDWRSDAEPVRYADAEGNEVNDTVTSFNFRASTQAEGGYNYLHCGGHSAGAGTSSWIVGWADGGATRWYLTPVDDATAEQWINGPAAQLRAKIAKGDSIASAFPAQLDIAKDLVAELDTTVSVATADNFESPFSCTSEGSVEQLFDGKKHLTESFWHSEWNSGSANAYSTTDGTNYFVVHDTEGLINGGLAIVIGRRPAANDHIVELTVYGTNDDYDLATATEALKADSEKKNDTYTWTKLGVLKTPYGSNTEDITSNAIEFEGKYKTYKFLCTVTSTGRGYFHMSEFRLYPATISKRYETTQYDARKTEADALSAAIAVWEEKEFAADSLELLEDETFATAYNNITTAGEAWAKVFVNPAALREAIAAAPAENLFVIGNNPGQWKEGVVTPTATVAAAEAYNAAGKYTPAESEAHIAAIAKAEANVWAAANPVETGKWYRLSFATEADYDKYGWDKTGAKEVENEEAGEVVSPALFGKIVAPGISIQEYVTYTNEEGEEVEVLTYDVDAADYFYEGNNLYFFDAEEAEFEEGEDLFQFIQATDSSYTIQNKATGLFVRAGHPVTLSAVPSYFATKAIGAGASLIAYTDVLGKTDGAHVYLHGQRSTNQLTKWEANTAGSNSMMFIEEVEAVTEAPATAYKQNLWPGKVYTYTMPVDVTVGEGATAYGAQLNVTEEDTTIVLQAIAEQPVKAGTPFIMIANMEGDYVSTADALAAIKEEIKAELEVEELTGNDNLDAQLRLEEMYAEVSMDHGMKVDTLVSELLSLRGTMKQVTVEAGKAIVAKENGFAHTLVNTNVAAYGAYIACDFDAESADVLSGLEIKIEGEIESGINEVLNKVAQSGNIYNAAGQIVAKGNINTVNNLPAGIYIVNGVKVTKK